MLSTGAVRRIDDLGRIVIPKDIRKIIGIEESDPMEIFIDNDKNLILKKYIPIEDNNIEDDFKCKKCNGILEHADTIDHEGGLRDNFYMERQIWNCEKCNCSYEIDKTIEISQSDINITYFEEC